MERKANFLISIFAILLLVFPDTSHAQAQENKYYYAISCKGTYTFFRMPGTEIGLTSLGLGTARFTKCPLPQVTYEIGYDYTNGHWPHTFGPGLYMRAGSLIYGVSYKGVRNWVSKPKFIALNAGWLSRNRLFSAGYEFYFVTFGADHNSPGTTDLPKYMHRVNVGYYFWLKKKTKSSED